MSLQLKQAVARHWPQFKKDVYMFEMARGEPSFGYSPEYTLAFLGLDLEELVGGEYGN